MNLYKTFSFLVLGAASCAAYAGNILANNGFETLRPNGEFVVDWGIHYIWSGPVTVVNDFAHAHGGSNAIYFNQRGPKAHKDFLTIGSSRCPTKPGTRYRLSVWAKGNGAVSMTAYFSANGEYLSSDGSFPPNHPLQSKFFPVKSKEYRQYHFDFTVPNELISINSGGQHKAAPQTVEVLFNVKGQVYLDDAELYPADQIPQQTQAFISDQERPALMTIPRFTGVPKIDGKLDDAVWQQASATTGFRGIGGSISPKQTIVSAGYDDKNLYIGFTVLQMLGNTDVGSDGEISQFPSNVEGFEVWMAPNGNDWYQLLVVPAGGFLSNSSTNNKHWGRQAEYEATYVESTMMFGGIMATDSRTWFGEIAIPFSAIGMDTPADGSELRINFCRDLAMVNQSDARSSDDWTSWSNVDDFGNTAKYGFLRFSPDTPAVRCLSLGDPETGSLILTGSANSNVKVQTRVRLPQFNNRVLQTATGGCKDNGEFALNSEIRVTGAKKTPMTVDFSVSDSQGKVLNQNSVPIIMMPAFGLSHNLLYSAKKIEITAEFARLSHSGNCKIEMNVIGSDGKSVAQAKLPVKTADRSACKTFDITGWKPGNYVVDVKFFNRNGQLLTGNNLKILIPEKPEWMDNKWFLDRSVPAPYTDMKQSGNKTSVVLRDYKWQNNGLPQSVTYKNHELFSKPATLTVKVNNKNEKMTFAPLKVVESSADLVRYAISGKSASVKISGTLDVEFDGFARWNVTVNSRRKGVILTDLALNFFMPEQDALFLRGDGYTGSLLQDKYSKSPRPSKMVHLGNTETMWGSWKYDAAGWNWNDKYFHEVVIGSDRYAFSVMSEDNEFIRGKKYISVNKNIPGTTRMTVSLVSTPTNLDKPLKYDYFFQTLPIRPEPENPKMWHASLDPSSIHSINIPGYLDTPTGHRLMRALYVGESYHDLAPQGFAKWAKDPKASEEAMAKFHSFGMKIVYNLWYAVIPEICPEYKTFGAEWRAYPEFYWTTPTSMMRSACLNSAYADFHIDNVAKIILETPFDGVYTDATPIFCNNGKHGCGWTDAKGKRHADFNLLATRRFVKQMYRILKYKGADKINFNHNGESPATAGFVDIRTDGEELIWEGKDHYRRITPDYFRSTYAQTEYGMPYVFHAVFHYSWRRVGDVVPVREIMMMTLPHRVSFALAYDAEILPVWEIVDPWWTTSDFRPYWYKNCPVTTSEPTEVLSSVFIKPEEKKALVIFSNWSYSDKSVNYQIDTEKLGFEVKKIVERDTVTGKERDFDPSKLSLKSRDFTIVELRGE